MEEAKNYFQRREKGLNVLVRNFLRGENFFKEIFFEKILEKKIFVCKFRKMSKKL